MTAPQSSLHVFHGLVGDVLGTVCLRIIASCLQLWATYLSGMCMRLVFRYSMTPFSFYKTSLM